MYQDDGIWFRLAAPNVAELFGWGWLHEAEMVCDLRNGDAEFNLIFAKPVLDDETIMQLDAGDMGSDAFNLEEYIVASEEAAARLPYEADEDFAWAA
jgi:hypothetical protein